MGDKDIISRSQAKERGLKTYFTGKSCKYGHITKRDVCSGCCMECRRLRTKRWRDEGYKGEVKRKPLPTKEELTELFSYEVDTGVLIKNFREKRDGESERTYKTWVKRFSGKPAGSKNHANGYIEVHVVGKGLYKAHRLIWKIMTGEDPPLYIDHLNGVRDDNRWENLRSASAQENARNAKTWSSTGYKGVSYHPERDKYVAGYCINDVPYFKRFDCAIEAAKWYKEQTQDIYGEYQYLRGKL